MARRAGSRTLSDVTVELPASSRPAGLFVPVTAIALFSGLVTILAVPSCALPDCEGKCDPASQYCFVESECTGDGPAPCSTKVVECRTIPEFCAATPDCKCLLEGNLGCTDDQSTCEVLESNVLLFHSVCDFF